MKPQKFTKKPVTIEAMRLFGSPAHTHAVTSWIQDHGYPFLVGNALEPSDLRGPDGTTTSAGTGIYIDPETGDLVIRTLEGDMHAKYGDWIIRGIQGEFYPCRDDIFQQTYEAVEGDS